MGKKRKASRASAPSGPREIDPADARLQVNSYEDLADSEEEYLLNRDKILLEEGPKSKRRKADREDEMLESSDEEVLDYGQDDDDDGDEEDESQDDDEDDDELLGKKKSARDDIDDPDDRGYWGSNKKEYYEADAVETEADALAEEAETKKLQQKKLARMSEADFVFDADEWLAEEKEEEADGDQALTEVLKDVDITSDMGEEEVSRILHARYPEFDALADELQNLQSLLPEYQKAAEGKAAKSLEVVQYWTLGCYLAALASYMAILTSPARDGDSKATANALDPASLRDHDVMATLVSCREAWARVQTLKPAAKGTAGPEAQSESDGEAGTTEAAEKSKDGGKRDGEPHSSIRKKKALDKKKLAKAKKLEESLADLDGLLTKAKKSSKKDRAPLPKAGGDEDDNSDFGDEEVLDASAAAQKAARKKTLRFYTSQITQKADRRAGAGRDAGGDMDIPYRERLRDRQARLNAEAERRGQKGSKHGEDLGSNDDDDDDDDDQETQLAKQVRGEEDDYYDMVAHGSRQKKAEKAARQEALKAAKKGDKVVQQEQVGEDGKRSVTYHILKNKGLVTKRKKDSQNPRVKKRKKFEQSKKKLKSMRAVYSGGEGRGGYQGELSGIKTGLVKSVKLS